MTPIKGRLSVKATKPSGAQIGLVTQFLEPNPSDLEQLEESCF